jgi:hypothetical protein
MPADAGARKVILFEMNEVPYRVLDDFAARHRCSHLAGIMARARQLDTVCEDQVELDPWISWPTLHRGVIDERHRITHLGQSLDLADRRYPPVWQLLAQGGRSVGVFGSLHSARAPASFHNYAFYVPDFFAAESFAHPPELNAFQQFNLVMTRRSARNVDGGIPLRAALAFVHDYLKRGPNWATVGTLLAALYAERRAPHLKTRRRSLQPLIGLDLFLSLMRRTRPDFATFYTNHVAANMHRFWAAAFPDDLRENPMPADWRRKYAGEIEYSMQVLDGMLGRLRAFADAHDYLLVVASSIGQAPVPATRIPGFTTLTDLERFMARLGIARSEWKRKPAMVPCISIAVAAEKADRFEARLKSLEVGGCPVRRQEREGAAPFTYDRSGDAAFHLMVYFEELDPARLAASLGGVPVAAADLGFGFFPHEEEVGVSGRHTPFGALLIYDPRRAALREPRTTISTLEIAPALLRNFGIPAPAYMTACAPHLLDVIKRCPATVHFRGGGVETPVTRHPQRAVHYG